MWDGKAMLCIPIPGCTAVFKLDGIKGAHQLSECQNNLNWAVQSDARILSHILKTVCSAMPDREILV